MYDLPDVGRWLRIGSIALLVLSCRILNPAALALKPTTVAWSTRAQTNAGAEADVKCWPQYPGAIQINSMDWQGSIWRTSGSVSAVQEFYETHFPRCGWQTWTLDDQTYWVPASLAVKYPDEPWTYSHRAYEVIVERDLLFARVRIRRAPTWHLE